jgi:ribosomal protein L11 methyltransferase
MTGWTVEVGPGAERPDLVARCLVELTGRAAEERPGGVVVGYLADPAPASGLAARLRSRFGPDLAVRLRPADPVDWSVRWRDGMEVRRVGRLAIGPSWLLEPGPGRVVVDPAMAFGTGEHGSTRSALALLDRLVRPGSVVLDLGSGSGILAIAAVQLRARRAFGIELDPEAASVAEANAARNRVDDRVAFLTGDAGLLLPLVGPADLIVANILRTANLALLVPMRRALAPAGVAVLAGMESAEREGFLEPLRAAGFVAGEEVLDQGWWAVAARPA